MVSKNCMTAIIVVSPAKGTILNNKIKFSPKFLFSMLAYELFSPPVIYINYIGFHVIICIINSTIQSM